MLPLMAGAQVNDPLKGKSIGVIGDSYVGNHHDPREYTWHYKFASARNSGIHVASDRFRSIYFQGGGVKDNAHLNAKGHDLFLPTAEAFILQHVK